MPSGTAISGARACVGPMMKFPSASAGGTAPSGNSLAVTYPGVFGSRVGGGGRLGRAAAGVVEFVVWANAGFTPAARLIKRAMLNSFVFTFHPGLVSVLMLPGAVVFPTILFCLRMHHAQFFEEILKSQFPTLLFLFSIAVQPKIIFQRSCNVWPPLSRVP
jgi:hypothetical protein